MIATACAFWFFAVMVSEPIDFIGGTGPHRSVGGWTHDGPYETKAQCDKMRTVREEEPIKWKLKARYKASRCYRETFREHLGGMNFYPPRWPVPWAEPEEGLRR